MEGGGEGRWKKGGRRKGGEGGYSHDSWLSFHGSGFTLLQQSAITHMVQAALVEEFPRAPAPKVMEFPRGSGLLSLAIIVSGQFALMVSEQRHCASDGSRSSAYQLVNVYSTEIGQVGSVVFCCPSGGVEVK